MGLKKKFMRAYYGLDTWREFWVLRFERIARLFGNRTEFYRNEHMRSLSEKYIGKDFMQIKDIRYPLLNEPDRLYSFMFSILEDTLGSYVCFGDRYDEKTFDTCGALINEGLYGLVNDKVSVTVEPGDIVIDAGSWIGDFAAYASVKGATTYAFEPSDENFAYLLKTAELNKNIIPVKKGLSDKAVTQNMFVNIAGNSGGDSFMNKSEDTDYQEASTSVEITTVDDFVRENKLSRVDFIKSDIEGFERNMLAGAQETLKKFAPKLALCTYHLPDDPEVMARLIKQANPAYNIVQKKMKLFASVPK